MLFAEAQHYNATVKVRAAVLELADANGNGVIVNRSGTARTISSGWLDTLLTFQSLNLSRDTIGIPPCAGAVSSRIWRSCSSTTVPPTA